MQSDGPDSQVILAPAERLTTAECRVDAEFGEGDWQSLPFGQVKGTHRTKMSSLMLEMDGRVKCLAKKTRTTSSRAWRYC